MDETPINTNAAEKIVSLKQIFTYRDFGWEFFITEAAFVIRLFSNVKEKAAELVNGSNPSCAKDRYEDTLVQLLGPDNPGRLRVMGKNMSKTKLACFQVKNKTMSEMKEKQIELQEMVDQLKTELAKVKNQVGEEYKVSEKSAARVSY